MSPAQMIATMDVDSLLLEWKEAKLLLDAAKEKEAVLRKHIVEESGLFDEDKLSGTQIYELGNGWKLKAVKKLNYNVDNTDGKAFAALAEIEKLGAVVEHIARDLFKFTPELRLKKYEELGLVSPEAKRIVDDIITTKPGMPSLELVEPRE